VLKGVVRLKKVSVPPNAVENETSERKKGVRGTKEIPLGLKAKGGVGHVSRDRTAGGGNKPNWVESTMPRKKQQEKSRLLRSSSALAAEGGGGGKESREATGDLMKQKPEEMPERLQKSWIDGPAWDKGELGGPENQSFSAQSNALLVKGTIGGGPGCLQKRMFSGRNARSEREKKKNKLEKKHLEKNAE